MTDTEILDALQDLCAGASTVRETAQVLSDGLGFEVRVSMSGGKATAMYEVEPGRVSGMSCDVDGNVSMIDGYNV